MRASRAVGLAAVVVLHGLVAWLGWRMLLGPKPDPVRPWVTLRLLPPERPVPARVVAWAPPPRLAPVVAAPAPALLAPPMPFEDAPGVATPSQPRPTGVAPPSAAGTASAPLDLRPSKEVLRGALAHPGTQDPRANTPRPSAEERMAMAIDPRLCVKAERHPDGSVTRSMSRLTRKPSSIEANTGHRGLDVWVCE